MCFIIFSIQRGVKSVMVASCSPPQKITNNTDVTDSRVWPFLAHKGNITKDIFCHESSRKNYSDWADADDDCNCIVKVIKLGRWDDNYILFIIFD